MLRLIGQILRFVGLLIEVLGFVCMAYYTRADEAAAPPPVTVTRAGALGLIGVGFVVWLVGTALNFWLRAGQRSTTKPRSSKLDLEL